jgi:hypothetical protein
MVCTSEPVHQGRVNWRHFQYSCPKMEIWENLRKASTKNRTITSEVVIEPKSWQSTAFLAETFSDYDIFSSISINEFPEIEEMSISCQIQGPYVSIVDQFPICHADDQKGPLEIIERTEVTETQRKQVRELFELLIKNLE